MLNGCIIRYFTNIDFDGASLLKIRRDIRNPYGDYFDAYFHSGPDRSSFNGIHSCYQKKSRMFHFTVDFLSNFIDIKKSEPKQADVASERNDSHYSGNLDLCGVRNYLALNGDRSVRESKEKCPKP